MGTKVLIAAICCLTIGKAVGDKSAVNSAAAVDNESAESAPRLYRSVPAGIYASAVPYGSYQIHLPRFIATPNTAASQVVPVKQAASGTSNNGFLKDSYGNKFVETPLTVGYKTAFPQEFLPLQKLPEHLAQPLVGASANFQFKQTAPQVFVGSPYRVPALEGPTPTSNNQFAGFSQPLVYAEKVRSLAPNSVNLFGSPTAQQQSTNNKAVFTSAHPYDYYSSYKTEPKFQKIQEIPRLVYGEPKYQHIREIPELPHGETKFQRIKESPSEHREDHKYGHFEEAPQHQQEQHEDNAPLQAVPAKKTVTYVTDVNGKSTIVQLKTDPPIPLLDLTLLEPLTFDNPLVPQVQHFLPKIPQVTYKKLPQAIPQGKKYEKEFVVQKTMSYDSGKIKGKANKKQKKPTKKISHNDIPQKTPVTHHETLDEAPEISYEINMPNYKETYKEKAVSYNKETTSAPVSYAYGSKTDNEPVTYSYSRSSQEPTENEEIRIEHPQTLVYNLSPEEQSEEKVDVQHEPSEEESESQRESSHESDDDGSYHKHGGQYKESPRSAKHHHELENDEQEHHQKQHHELKNDEHEHHQKQHHQLENDEQEHHQQQHHELENDEKEHHQKQHHELANVEQEHNQKQHQRQETPRDVEVFNSEKNYPPPKEQHVQSYEQFHPIIREYEEDIRLIPTPSAAIRVDPNQHVQHVKPTQQPHPSPSPHHEEHSSSQHRQPHPSSAPQHHSHSHPSSTPEDYHYSAPHSEYYSSTPPRVHEKSKRIIIKEESPEGLHMIAEKMREEMIEREENSEEDFEKAYKDSAIGFPAYSKPLAESEKDIYNPESYGVPQEHIEYKIEDGPFQQYQDQSDDYPKETRSRYKDARDKTKGNYYADYKVIKPESLHDRYRNKVDYYKVYRDNKPDYLVDDVEDDKKKQKQKSAKFTAAPSHNYPSQQKAQSYYAPYQPKQQLYGYDYSKEAHRDNSAFASRPHHIYKLKTNFVEPQFQYGFEPISIPRLLDSELAAMASNLSPESEKPGMRKKIYKENWYIKQTSTSAGDGAS